MLFNITILIITYLMVKLLKGFWTCYLAYRLGFGVKWRSGDNVWAVVTGATDGIGLEYAKQLAEKGYSLLLISRSEEKLKDVAKNINDKFTTCKQVKILTVNFERTDIYGKVKETISSLEHIDVLVNNVGIMDERPTFFTHLSEGFNQKILNVNILSMIKMTELILPKMIVQRRGIIINISSIISTLPSPLLATYSASKAFVSHFSKTLAIEYESKGIVIQTVCPSLVLTKLIDNLENILTPYQLVTCNEYVSSALKTVGIEWYTFGHWKHKLLAFLNNTVLLGFLGEKNLVRIYLKIIRNCKSKNC